MNRVTTTFGEQGMVTGLVSTYLPPVPITYPGA
jgi:hypothetical protein